MAYTCDPCVCPDMYYRDSMSWRKAMILLLCRIRQTLIDASGNETPVV